jgi:hypothetical protein
MNRTKVLFLICNDEQQISLAEKYLAKRAYSVLRAESQPEAVGKLKSKIVHLLFLKSAVLAESPPLLAEYLPTGEQNLEPLFLLATDLTQEESQALAALPGMKSKVERPVDIGRLENLLESHFSTGTSIPGLEPDDDPDKPLVDHRDQLAIAITLSLHSGVPNSVQATLVEYSENSLLIEVFDQQERQPVAFQPGDRLEVLVQCSGPGGDSEVRFQGQVISVEEDPGGSRMLLVDSSAASSEFSEKIINELSDRQQELLKFLEKVRS